MEGTNPLMVETIILGLTLYFSPVNFLSKQKGVMRRRTRKPRGLKVRLYAARLININDYLDSFPGATLSEKWINWIEWNFSK